MVILKLRNKKLKRIILNMKKRMIHIQLLFLLILAFCGANSQTLPTRFDSVKIRNTHPRIWVDAEKLLHLKEKCKGKTAQEIEALAGPSTVGLALTYVITGDESFGRQAIHRALDKPVNPGSGFNDLNSSDGENKRIHFQSTLTDRALCYDWCYNLLTSQEKVELRDKIVPEMKKHIAFKRAWRSFHNGMYDLAWPVTAGMLALYGDEPYAKEAWDFLKPEIEDALQTFENVFPDGAWGEGYDYNRHSTYPAIKLLLALKSATGADFLKDSRHIRNTGKYMMYGTKANGLALSADDNDWPYLGPWDRVALLMLNDEFKDGYIQSFLNNCPVERFKLEPHDRFAELLWYNPSVQEKPLTELPLSSLFRGKGLVMLRSNWNWDSPGKYANSAWLSFHCGDYFGDHVHFDINSFSISYNGELAIDAGRYDCDWGVEDWTSSKDSSRIRQSQFFNYYKRTIAHNTILVNDPNERMSMNLLNDGGQIDLLRVKSSRNVPEDYDQGNFPSEDGIGKCDWATNPGRWETGDIAAYKSTRDFMYVCGDGTKAYSQGKMNAFVRQLFFLNPDLVVVFDRVESTKPEYKKTWLLHSVNEPQFASDGKTFELTDGGGRLVCVPVLPHKLRVNKIGGPGNEFLVDTTHFQCGLKSHIDPQELHYGEIPGAWRVEESPAESSKENYFLNVILLTDKDSVEKPIVKLLSETTETIAVQINTANGKTAVITFQKGKKSGAALKLLSGKTVLADEKMPDGIVCDDKF
jgi:heparin/heparan-sulfate lyase